MILTIAPPALEIDKRLGQPNTHGQLERRAIANLLHHLIQKGFTPYSIHDGETNTKANTIQAAMELIFNLDECHIFVADEHMRRHYIFIVLGNGDIDDLICDWSYTTDDRDGFNAAMEEFLK